MSMNDVVFILIPDIKKPLKSDVPNVLIESYCRRIPGVNHSSIFLFYWTTILRVNTTFADAERIPPDIAALLR